MSGKKNNHLLLVPAPPIPDINALIAAKISAKIAAEKAQEDAAAIETQFNEALRSPIKFETSIEAKATSWVNELNED